jgi:hypothetical protein
MGTNYIQRHFWQKEPIPFFKSLDNPKSSNIMLISCFNTRLVNFKSLKGKKWVYYSGERFLSEKNSDIIISFIPNSSELKILIDNEKYDNMIIKEVNMASTKYEYKMPGIDKKIKELDIQKKVFIQLRDQEREHIEYILNNTAINDIYSFFKNIRLYTKLNEEWYNTYNKLVNNRVKKDKFCCFIVSNPQCWERNKMFDLLRIICGKKVDSLGKWKKNVDIIIPERSNREEYLKLISQYRFMITFENHSLPWYNTEKIYNAFSAGTIPIYWGDPLITDIYNPDCFIHVKTFNDKKKQIDELINTCNIIKEIEDDILLNGLTASTKYLSYYCNNLINNVDNVDNKVKDNLIDIYNLFYDNN